MSLTSTILTVSQLTFAIKNQLETHYRFLTVQGEIFNCKLHTTGHLYFDLKDVQAKIPVVFFRKDLSCFPRLPKEGEKVIIKGSLSVYPPQGRYQIIGKELSYLGIGQLLIQREKLKEELQKKGWLDSKRKKDLPPFPQKIGVVTSPTGAVIRDIIHVLSRRFSGFHLILNPVKVQGKDAVEEIACAIEDFNRYALADVLIIGRGGGSLEDLWAFNEKRVAEAIFHSHIPIVSAVGHETDTTIADLVADLRAPTPSAAAELVVSEKKSHLRFLCEAKKRIYQALCHLMQKKAEHLNNLLKHPLFHSSDFLLSSKRQCLDEIKERIDALIENQYRQKRLLLSEKQKFASMLNPQNQILTFKKKLLHLEKLLHQSQKSLLLRKRECLDHVIAKLKTMDPKNVLKRGYTILFAEKDKTIVTSTETLDVNDELHAIFSKGEAQLKVIAIKSSQS